MGREAKSFLCDVEACEHCLAEWFSLASRVAPGHSFGSVARVWTTLRDKDVSPEHWAQHMRGAKCPKCKTPLELADRLVYTSDNFRSELVECVAKVISEASIAECPYCSQEVIPYHYGRGTALDLPNVSEVLRYDYEVPADLYDDVLGLVRCRRGHKVHEEDPIVSDWRLKNWYGEEDPDHDRWEWLNEMVQTFKLTRNAVMHFKESLIRLPMMALHHKVGKQVLDAIRNGDVPGIGFLQQGLTLYRARTRDIGERKASFLPEEMWAPPAGKAKQGRFNPVGVPVLYLGDSERTCIKEVGLKKIEDEVADVGEFVLLRKMKVWDLRDTDLTEFVSELSATKNPVSANYLFSNFLSQCCSLAGVDGVVYSSTKHSRGWNIALFHYIEGETLQLTGIQTNRRDIDSRRMRSRKATGRGRKAHTPTDDPTSIF